MRFKLLRRRLTISAPKMAVRSTLPWPLRWLVIAVVLGFAAALCLWAFEFGRDLAGFDSASKEELPRLRADVARLTQERDKAQSVGNTSESLLATERATEEKLIAQVRQLEAENRSLKDDLGFFEKLMPTSGVEGLSIRGLQAEKVSDTQVKWQVLLMQSSKNPGEFNGRLEVTMAGTRAGKPWTLSPPESAQELQLRQFRRVEGLMEIPGDVAVKSVTVKVYNDNLLKVQQTVKL